MRLGFYQLFILFLLGSLGAGPAFAQKLDSCLQEPSEMQCLPKKSPARDACELELKTAQCDEYIRLHPELKTSGKLRDCSRISVCENPAKTSDFLKNCGLPAATAAWDGIVGVFHILTGEVGIPSEQDLSKLEFFKHCTTVECKRKMLGPFASYFSKEEIEGHRDRPDLNPDDVANQNYLQGYSAMVLYRKLLLKLKKDFQTRGMNEKFIEPWSGQEAKLPLSMNELIEKVLTSVGITNTACFKPEVVSQMRCYALGSLIDPTLVAGAGVKIAKMAGLAAKEALIIEKTTTAATTAVKAANEALPSTSSVALSTDRQVSLWQNYEQGNSTAARAQEAKLAQEYQTAKIKSSKPVPFLDGVTGGSYVELADGTKGIWKPDSVDGSSTAAEVSAYQIDRHLGLNSVPITVRKQVDGKEGSFQLWVHKTQESKVDDPSHFVFYDYLIGNSDRHAGNYLIAEGRPVAIDNGNAFRPQSGVEDFPGHVDHILKEQKRKETKVLEQRAQVDRARRAGVAPANLRKMQEDLNKVEKEFQVDKKRAAQKIADLGLTKEAAQKLKTTSNPEWNRLMQGLDSEERAGFFFRKTLAEDAIKKAEEYFGQDIYRDPKKPVEFKKATPVPEKNPYVEDLVGSGL